MNIKARNHIIIRKKKLNTLIKV